MFEALTQAEGAFLIWIQENLRNPALNGFFKVITHLGDATWVVIMAAAMFLIPGGLLYLNRKKPAADRLSEKHQRLLEFLFRLSWLCIAGLLFSLVINNLILKNLVARVRPYDEFAALKSLVGPQVDYSFPSGHTGASLAATWVIFRETPKKVGIWALAYSILIAFSRLYVGVHYPTDVLCGAVTGILCAELGRYVIQKYLGK